MLRYLALLLLCYYIVPAQTIIPHDTAVSGIWTKAHSPYIIEGRATIPQDSTLNIEAGVEIQMATLTGQGQLFSYFHGDGLGYLEVLGNINALGTDTEPIYFTRVGGTGGSGFWGAVILVGTSPQQSILKHCVFQYGSGLSNVQSANSEDLTGTLSFYQKQGVSENNVFYDCQYDGICAINTSNLRIQKNEIFYFNYSGINVESSNVAIRQTEIAYSTASSGSRVNAGIRSYVSNILITNSIIHHLSSNAIYAWGGRGTSLLNSYNNTFAHNEVGLRLLFPGSSSFINCIFAYNNLNFDPRANNVLFEHCLTNSIEYDSRITLIGSNLKNTNPQFIDGPNGDYRLFGNSPAVNAGKINSQGLGLDPEDFSGKPRIIGNRIDIGAIEHQPYFEISEFPFEGRTDVYPNPFKDEIYLELELENVQYLDWSLLNSSGQKVMEGRILAFPNQAACLPTEALIPGSYFLELKDAQGYKRIFKLRAR